MLSIKPLNNAGNTAAYFFELEKYYVKGDTVENSRWFGKGAEEFNLSGNVDRETFSIFLNGELPNGQTLGRIRNNKREHRPGIDLTFSAPKSVSILAYVLGHSEVISDHESSVTAALKFVQDNFAQARMKLDKFKKDIDFVHTQHLTAALFQHPTSRALDPQLHTHAIVMNMTKCPDGKYRSLSRGPVGQSIDAYSKGVLEQLFHNQRTVGAVYRGFLAHELFKRGAEIHMTHKDARFEVKGVSESLIKTFSKRRADIESLLNEKGFNSARAASIATAATNRAKAFSDLHKLKEEWRSQCTANDFQKDYFSHADQQRTKPVFHGLSVEQAVSHTRYMYADAQTLCDKVLTYATADLNEREASFTWQDLIVRSIYYAKGCLSPLDLTQGIERWHTKDKLIGSTDIQGKEARLTTPEALQLENDTIFWMQRGQDTHTVNPLFQKREMSDRFKQHAPDYLKEGQKAALGLIATTNERVIGIQGNPGVGKTTMLRVANEWANDAGYFAIGLAASADAARTLHAETNIPSFTIAKFLTEKSRKLDKLTMVIVDEASLVSTSQMNQLVRLTHDHHSRLILVGDIRQLGAIQHGKPFYELMRVGMKTAQMSEILRQRNQRLKGAVYDAIMQQYSDSLDKLKENIQEIESSEKRLEAIANTYLKLSPQERAQTKIATAKRSERETLNTLIRDGQKDRGHYKGKHIRTQIYERKDLKIADKSLAANYKKGDVIRFNRRYKRLGIAPGDYLTVRDTDAETNTVTLQHSLGGNVSWRPHKLAARKEGAMEVYEVKERELAAGDIIRWTCNDHQQRRLNGQLAKVLSVNLLGAKVEILNRDGSSQSTPKTASISFARSRDAHWEHAYAWTTYSLQGQTCERILVNMPAEHGRLAHQKAYLTAISRARQEAIVFTDNKYSLEKVLVKNLGSKTSALNVMYKMSQPTVGNKSKSRDEMSM